MSHSLFGPLTDVQDDAGYDDHPPRTGFFTDTSVYIGCKAFGGPQGVERSARIMPSRFSISKASTVSSRGK